MQSCSDMRSGKGCSQMAGGKNLVLRIIAGLAAIGLILLVLSTANAFIGNPISKSVNAKAINKYVEQNYPSMGLEIGETKYDFKFNEYTAKVRSNTSIDTKFTVSSIHGKVKSDDYKDAVLGKYNTITRFMDEYAILAKTILSKEAGLPVDRVLVSYDKEKDIRDSSLLEVDMPFDRKLDLDPEVIIYLKSQDTSLETAAKTLTTSHKFFLKDECIFSKYTLYLENDSKELMVFGITPEDIEGGELVKLLQEAEGSDGTGRIYVHINNVKR